MPVSRAMSEIPPDRGLHLGQSPHVLEQALVERGRQPEVGLNASLPVTTTSVPAYASVKTVVERLSIVSVRT